MQSQITITNETHQVVDQHTLELGLSGLEVITADEHVLLHGHVDQTCIFCETTDEKTASVWLYVHRLILMSTFITAMSRQHCSDVTVMKNVFLEWYTSTDDDCQFLLLHVLSLLLLSVSQAGILILCDLCHCLLKTPTLTRHKRVLR